MYQIPYSTYQIIWCYLHYQCLIRLKQTYIPIFRKHQGQIRANEKWNGEHHPSSNERNEGKAGHLDGLTGGEQRWRSVVGENYKDKHNFTITGRSVIGKALCPFRSKDPPKKKIAPLRCQHQKPWQQQKRQTYRVLDILHFSLSV